MILLLLVLYIINSSNSHISVPVVNIDAIFAEGPIKNNGNSKTTLICNEAKVNLIKNLIHIMSTIGICIIKLEGDVKIDENTSFNAGKRLFSTDTKFRKECGLDMNGLRGYIARDFNNGRDSKEGYAYGNPHINESMLLDSLIRIPNVWPDGVDGKIIEALESQYIESNRIVEAIVQTLSSQDPIFQEYAVGGLRYSLMRLWKYNNSNDLKASDIENAKNRDTLGSSPHTDWGFMTLIKSNNYGLQIFHDSTNIWIDVPHVPGSYTLIVGEYLSSLSNAFYKAPRHRVINNHLKMKDDSRLSFVFFYQFLLIEDLLMKD